MDDEGIISHGMTDNELGPSIREIHCPNCGVNLGEFKSDDPATEYWTRDKCMVCKAIINIHMTGQRYDDVLMSYPMEDCYAQYRTFPIGLTRRHILVSGLQDIIIRWRLTKGWRL